MGWAASANNDRALALGALVLDIAARASKAGLNQHFDRGGVYASADCGTALAALSPVKSMSRKGDCWDNAVAESFFATIKGELNDHQESQTRTVATDAIGDYLDGFYNLRRRHSALDDLRPIEFELKFEVDELRKMTP